MADKINQIPISDDLILQVPAWASETTMEALAMQSKNAVSLTKEMLGDVKKNTKLDDEIIEAVEKNLQIGVKNSKANEENAKGRSSLLLKGAQQIKDTATFFGDSEKPLTSMVSATEDIVKKLKGASGKLDKSTAAQIPFAKMMTKTLGQVANVAVDIGLAWAGWNAAKFEQFAEVQKMMIDSGAIVYDTADVFDQLYKDSFQAGITYKSFASIISNFGGTMVGIGGDVSRGAQAYIGMFKRLSDNSEILGDLGMSNVDLMNAYAGYIETQRITGQLDKQLVGEGEALEASFKSLVLESGAIANLTALTRGETMAKMLGALSDTNLAAGLAAIEDQGLEKTADVVESLAKQISLFSDVGPSDLLGQVQTAMNNATAQFSHNMGNFDIIQVLRAMDGEAVGALEVALPGLLTKINETVQDAETTGGKLSETFLIDILATYDRERLAAVAAGNQGIGRVQSLQNSLYLIMQNFGKLEGVNMEEQKKIQAKMQEASGKSTVAMNDMSKMFLTAQEFITYPMQDMGEKLEFVTGLLADGSDWLNGLFNDYKEDSDATVESKDNTVNSSKNDTSKVSATTVLENVADLPANATEKDLPMLKERLTTLTNPNIITNTPRDFSGAVGNAKKRQIEEQIRLTKLMITSLEKEIQIKENIQFSKEARIAMGYING